MKTRMGRKGFTLIEILVVASVVSLLSAMLIVYGRSGEAWLALYKEQAQLQGVLYRAKALSVETYSDPDPPCGYGIHFDLAVKTYLLYRKAPNPDQCKSSNPGYFPYSVPDDIVIDRYTLDPRFSRVFFETTIEDLFFLPPNPKIFILPGSLSNGEFILKLSGSASQLKIKVNSMGQITI